MINQVNSVGSNTNVYTSTTALKQEHNDVQLGLYSKDAAVVELKGSVIAKSQHEASAVDPSKASALADDIASLLGAHGGKVQEHLNGFDAARLLADQIKEHCLIKLRICQRSFACYQNVR